MHYVDLTQIISQEMPVYPGTETPKFTHPCTLSKDGFREMKMHLYNHTGTHIDGPAHLFEDGLTLDKFPIDYFTGKATVIDCRQLEPWEKIDVELINLYSDVIASSDYVIFYTGWSKKWGHRDYFEGIPSISPAAATMLTKYNLKGVGIDAITVDPIDSAELTVHKILLKKRVLIMENLTNLDSLVGSSFNLCCFPLKVQNTDSSPIRAVAIVD